MSGAESNLSRDQEVTLQSVPENTWIEVIQKMESVYSDLVETQIKEEQKNAELEEAQRFIRSVLTSMTDVLVVSDLRGRIQQVNRALEVTTGRPAGQLLGRPLASLFADEFADKVESFLGPQECESLIDCEVGLKTRDGGTVPLAMNCSNRYDADNRRVGTVLLGRPIGELRLAYDDLHRTHQELKEAQAQLVQSEKMASLGRLVAGVAHELNNPISFVFGNMRALQQYGERINRFLGAVDDQLPPEELARLREIEKIDRIMADMDSLIEGTLEGAERVRDIVQDLRRYSTQQTEAVCRFDLAESVRKGVRWVLKACRVKPEVAFDTPESVMISGRQGHVHQILINLVQNAVDVMEGQQKLQIDIACDQGSERVRVTVRDHGPGIPEQHFTRLFDPFFTTKPVGKGTGLGLSICYRLATDHGGDLTARNHPDGGAEFSLVLPVEYMDRG